MLHVTARTFRMAQSGNPRKLPAHKNSSPSVIRVTVNTSGKQQDVMVADDISVRKFKEKLSAHLKCKMDQLVLVFMGRLLRDHDTLNQRGILDGHTIHLVIKSKHGSQPLDRSSWNLPSNEPCNKHGSIKGYSSRVRQPAGRSQTPVKSSLNVEPDKPKANTQNLESSSVRHMAQMLENVSIQRLPHNIAHMRRFISEHPEMQQLIQQNPEVSHIFDNCGILWQTLELARNLSIIQEIRQSQQSLQNLEHSQNLRPCPCSETIPSGMNTLGSSHDDLNDQMTNSLQDHFEGNLFTTLLSGQVPEKVKSSPSPTPPLQQWWDKLPQLPTTRIIYTSSCNLFSTSVGPRRVNHTSRVSAAATCTKDQGHPCAIQQPVAVPVLQGRDPTQPCQGEGKDDISPNDSDSRRGIQLLDKQTYSQIAENMTQLLMSNPCLAVQMILFLNIPQLREQWRQQKPTLLQQTQLSNLLRSLANPEASQAIVQIEQGLQLLARVAPILLSWVAPYFWALGWLPAPTCTHPDMAPWPWGVPDMADPKETKSYHKSAAVFQRLQSLAEDPSNSLQALERHFRKQKADGNHHEKQQAVIAAEGDTSAAIHKCKRSQRY
ncbi:ubiquilin-like protein [Rhynchocyon petersi]